MVGSSISHYKILDQLGEGGMGVVYKAQDTKLDRTVALKFLAAHLLNDDEAKQRFLREAKASAALHHPNICTVYEVDEAEGKTFLAMALLEGEALEDRIAQGPLPLKDALEIGRQTAEGLEAAHEKGIVHRDVKPANIMVDAKGRATIMDFGLARLTEASKLTRADQTVGTAAYMSPEQIQGLEVDQRTDIWALGCVLYEMVTGLRPFKGQYDQALAYEIVHEEPEPLTAVRAGVPMELEFIVGKCLAKEAEARYADAGEIAKDLRTLSDKLKSGRSTILSQASIPVRTVGATQIAPAQESEKPRSLRAFQMLAAALALALAGLSVAHFNEPPPPERLVRRFSIAPESFRPASYEGVRHAAISPDGRWIVYLASDDGSTRSGDLWLRPLNSEHPRRLEGTEESLGGMFWSPDSAFIGFASQGSVKKIAISGGPPVELCALRSAVAWSGGDWSADGKTILFAGVGAGGRLLFTVPAIGGEAKPLERVGGDKGASSHVPRFLPGKALVLLDSLGSRTSRDIYVRNIETGASTMLVEGSNPVYSPTGHILYQQSPLEGGLWALPFSIEKLEPTGEPFPVAPDVGYASLATDGTLLTTDVGDAWTSQQLVWTDREGKKLGEIGQPQVYLTDPEVSPDGIRVAVQGRESGTNSSDIWLHHVDRPVKQRLNSDAAQDSDPTWAPSGNELAFVSRGRQGNGDLALLSADGKGAPQALVASPDRERLGNWSPDGRWLVFSKTAAGAGTNLWILPFGTEGNAGEPRPLIESPANEAAPRISPDGRYLAYSSDESGVFQVFVQDFPEGDQRWQVSTNGGFGPKWSRDGEELYYIAGGTLTAVAVSLSPNFSFAEPTALFRHGGAYAVGPNGRFVTIERVAPEVGEKRKPAIQITENWYEEFRGREQD